MDLIFLIRKDILKTRKSELRKKINFSRIPSLDILHAFFNFICFQIADHHYLKKSSALKLINCG